MTRGNKASLLLIFLLALVFPAPVTAAGAGQPDKILVYYAGPPGGVLTALKLSGDFELTDNPEKAQVLVLNGSLPASVNLTARLRSGSGLLLIMGEGISEGQLEDLFITPVILQESSEPLSLVASKGITEPTLKDIAWNSSPQVRERASFTSPELQPLVIGYEQPEPILSRGKGCLSNLFILSPYLDGKNSQLQEWPYFNYLIYHLTSQAAGRMPQSFGDYPASPVPHPEEQRLLFVILGGLVALSAALFILVRRFSLRHPELLDTLVIDRQDYEIRQAHTDWEQVGFHRALGGFLLSLMFGLLLFIPLIIYQNLVLPVYILPSAQALGIWGRVTQFFNFLWLFLDFGTSSAFIKFFAQYRVHDPRKAIQYGQVFVWWQALSGAVQVGLFVVLAGTVLPKTAYAIYAWSVIIHTFIQIPGFYQVMRHSLMAWQRFDYAQIVDLGIYVFLPMLTQPVIVTAFVLWGRSHPAYGSTMGGLIGLGLAAYASEALAFLLGLWLYQRTGYNARLLFLAHFNWETVKSAFRFGLFEMLASVAWAGGQAVEIILTQTRLVNYNEVWGNWVLAQNFIFSYQVVQNLYSNVMPSISESFSSARRVLSQYYAAVSYKWGGLISAFIGAVLLAVADRFIIGASGPQFIRAAGYAVPLVIWGAIQYPSWVADNVQLACNRPYLKSGLVAAEQVVRISLAFLLLERFQINALIMAYFIGLLSKDLAAYAINDRLCFRQRFYFWQSLAAPLLSGAVHFLILRWVTGLIWKGDPITSILIFLIGILFSFPLFAFLYGLFGGWDDGTLHELRRSVDLSGFMRPLAWLFWASNEVGAHLSPLHGRFPIDIRTQALAEAHSLTQERVQV